MTEKEAKEELCSYLYSKKLEERKLEQIEEVSMEMNKEYRYTKKLIKKSILKYAKL